MCVGVMCICMHMHVHIYVRVRVCRLLGTMWIRVFACGLTYLGLYGEATPQYEGDKCHQGAHQQDKILDCLRNNKNQCTLPVK